MKLSKKIPLLMGVVVLVTSTSIIITAEKISTESLEKAITSELASGVSANARLVSAKLETQLVQVWEIANRARTRTMNWEGVIRPNLMPDIKRIDVLELGVVFPDGTAHYVSDNSSAALGDRNYVMQAFAGKSNVSDVLISRVINTPVVMLAAPIFKNDEPNAPVLGVLIARKDSRKAMNQLVNEMKLESENSYAFMVNSEGTMMAHQDFDMVFNQFNPIKEVKNDPSLKSLADMITNALKEKSGIASYEFQGRQMITSFTEVPGHPWILFVAMSRADFEAELSRMRTIILFIGLICIVAGLAVSIIIGRSIAKPVNNIAAAVKVIGEGDLTRRTDIRSKNEIGDLSRFFNVMLDNISGLVKMIKEETVTLAAIEDKLNSSSSNSSRAVGKIAATITGVKERAINQSASATETNATIKQISINIDKLNEFVENQSAKVSQSSASLEKMITEISSVNDALAVNSKSMTELLSSSEQGRSALQEVASDLKEIARESEGLLEINSVIKNIASKTNLLSMNAAIEAAHAGETGKGFAVVADEIRKLAENSGEQSKTISGVLKKIKASIDKMSHSTDAVLQKFEAIDGGVKIVSGQNEDFRTVMEGQTVESRQILKVFDELNTITGMVKNGSGEMLTGSKEIMTEGQNLERSAQEINDGMTEMEIDTGEINNAFEQVNEVTEQNSQIVNDLVKAVSRFKIE
jgi:methyl-accepting chemotaxis protein